MKIHEKTNVIILWHFENNSHCALYYFLGPNCGVSHDDGNTKNTYLKSQIYMDREYTEKNESICFMSMYVLQAIPDWNNKHDPLNITSNVATLWWFFFDMAVWWIPDIRADVLHIRCAQWDPVKDTH